MLVTPFYDAYKSEDFAADPDSDRNEIYNSVRKQINEIERLCMFAYDVVRSGENIPFVFMCNNL